MIAAASMRPAHLRRGIDSAKFPDTRGRAVTGPRVRTKKPWLSVAFGQSATADPDAIIKLVQPGAVVSPLNEIFVPLPHMEAGCGGIRGLRGHRGCSLFRKNHDGAAGGIPRACPILVKRKAVVTRTAEARALCRPDAAADSPMGLAGGRGLKPRRRPKLREV